MTAWMMPLAIAFLVMGPTLLPAFPGTGSTLGSMAQQLDNLDEVATQIPSVTITEVHFKPKAGQFEWVELTNLTNQAVVTKGFQLVDAQGNVYAIPEILPLVPANAFVLVRFDGLGGTQDDLDFADGLAILHSRPGLVDFLDDADHVALYLSSERNSNSILDFVAWGGPPGQRAADAIAAGLWPARRAVVLIQGFGVIPENSSIPDGLTIGLYPGHQPHDVNGWVIYEKNEATPGRPNGIPAPAAGATPPDDITLVGPNFSLRWTAPGSAGQSYQFQLAASPEFRTPLVDTTLTKARFTPAPPLPSGTYFWHVKTRDSAGRVSPWSITRRIRFLSRPQRRQTKQAAQPRDSGRELAVPLLGQHKDTRMLCLYGDAEHDPFYPWDGAQVDDGAGSHAGQNGGYCARAAIAMVAAFYGGTLSQDRISFHAFGQVPLFDDLGHGEGMSINGVLDDSPFSWALNGAQIERHPRPSFAQIRTWIDQGRPLIVSISVGPQATHAVVVRGYSIIDDPTPGSEYAIVNDPTDPDVSRAWRYLEMPIIEVFAPPAGAHARSDEQSMQQDSDGDGIVDFDEIYRFLTNPHNPDSDGDGVPDKLDVREYVFDENGSYRYRLPDFDGDGLRKELDPDNDNDCQTDGEEDRNHNGRQDPGESSNFAIDVACRWEGTEVATVVSGGMGQFDTGSYAGSFQFTINPDGSIRGSGSIGYSFTRNYPSPCTPPIFNPPPPYQFTLRGRLRDGQLTLVRTFTLDPTLTQRCNNQPFTGPSGITVYPTFWYAFCPSQSNPGGICREPEIVFPEPEFGGVGLRLMMRSRSTNLVSYVVHREWVPRVGNPGRVVTEVNWQAHRVGP